MSGPRKPPKPKVCKVCLSCFTPRNSLQKVCSPKCAYVHVRQEGERLAEREMRKKEKQERAAWRIRKANVKPLKHWEDLTQVPCNAYILERDRDAPCISCGTWESPQWEAGHYRSRGSASHLRYDPDNIHKQCNRCNRWLSGNQQQYRINLIAKIGLQRVLALENDNTPHRYTREELDAIRARYRKKLRELITRREEAA
ncbi:recombination protein NinG [Sodalis endosymbiont of Spalangia cameroni]|uniref:recombination protein NinG n=1 Tax=Sodalis praecaptivus TaxID=1239307 RepID=UPI0031F91998